MEGLRFSHRLVNGGICQVSVRRFDAHLRRECKELGQLFVSFENTQEVHAVHECSEILNRVTHDLIVIGVDPVSEKVFSFVRKAIGVNDVSCLKREYLHLDKSFQSETFSTHPCLQHSRVDVRCGTTDSSVD